MSIHNESLLVLYNIGFSVHGERIVWDYLIWPCLAGMLLEKFFLLMIFSLNMIDMLNLFIGPHPGVILLPAWYKTSLICPTFLKSENSCNWFPCPVTSWVNHWMVEGSSHLVPWGISPEFVCPGLSQSPPRQHHTCSGPSHGALALAMLR